MGSVTSTFSQETPGSAYSSALRRALIGTWRGEIGSEWIELVLRLDDTYSMGSSQGSYTVTSNTLTFIGESSSAYQVSMTGRDSLILTGGDLGTQVRLQKVPDTGAILATFLQIDPARSLKKIISIGMILFIVISSRLILFLLKLLSRALIFSNRGPLRYVYNANKSRTRTVHSLTLDVVKYIVYFTAIGFILSEMGVNYTAYLASLSVIGLAIGFGSQGLVQDIVTGFFLVFEDQFNVGDMVEISGRYIAGALEGFIDCGIDRNAFNESSRVALGVASAISNQFDNVFLSDDFRIVVVSAEAGKTLLRCSFAIWPGQTWIVDQHLIPRLKTAFSEESIALNLDSPSVCYHIRHEQEFANAATSISKLRRRLKRVSPSDKA